MIKGGMVKEDEIQDIKNRISFTNDLEEACQYGDYIQENLPENYQIKQDFVKDFDNFASSDTILGSSTSGLLISEIAKDAKHPERIIGAHPYNPPHLIPLIEIALGKKSDKEAANLAKAMFEKLGKKPIILNKETPGFIANRFQALILREIMYLVDQGVVSVEDADRALTFGPGIRYAIFGQCQIFELGGGKGGLEGLINHLGPSIESWLEDTSTAVEIDEEAAEKTVKGVKEAIKNRPPEKGNNDSDLQKYRDGMLMEILKLHEDYTI